MIVQRKDGWMPFQVHTRNDIMKSSVQDLKMVSVFHPTSALISKTLVSSLVRIYPSKIIKSLSSEMLLLSSDNHFI